MNLSLNLYAPSKLVDLLLEKEKQWHYTSLTSALGRSSGHTHIHTFVPSPSVIFLKVLSSSL